MYFYEALFSDMSCIFLYRGLASWVETQRFLTLFSEARKLVVSTILLFGNSAVITTIEEHLCITRKMAKEREEFKWTWVVQRRQTDLTAVWHVTLI